MLPERSPGHALEPFLAPTTFVESDHAAIRARVASLALDGLTRSDRAKRLFEHVRSGVRYEFMAKFARDDYRASHVLEANQGFCVQKAVLLTALSRAAGVPAAILLCDMRDHALPEKAVRVIGTNVMKHHGLSALWVGGDDGTEGHWVRVDASLDPRFLDKKRYPRVAFDGRSDALLPGQTLDGAPAAEYLVFHEHGSAPAGRHADLPFDETVQAFIDGYQEADLQALVAMGLKTG